MHKEVCRGGVQLHSGGAGDEVENLGSIGVKRGGLDRIHGDECNVVEDVNFNPLYVDAVEGRVNTVSDGGGGGRELGSISLDDVLPFAEGEALLNGRGGPWWKWWVVGPLGRA